LSLRLEIGAPEHLDWAARRIGEAVNWGDDACCLAIVDHTEKISGVVVYNLFMKHSCCAHIATDGRRNWATRGMLYGIFSFPFVQLNLDRITLPIAEKNKDAQVLAVKLGFSWEGRLMRSLGDDNEVIFGMLREDCIWIKED
jgi:hypothetical protein